MDLSFIRKYVVRNPYTGGFTLDAGALESDPALRALLAEAWQDGYGAGADDIIADVSLERAHINPYSV